MNYIYKITNLINNKIYVGQTRKKIEQRMNEHISASCGNEEKKDYNFLLHKAIRKYGHKQFTIEVLEELEDERDLAEREQYWIHKLHSCILDEDCQGYNMTYGGEGTSYINRQEVYSLWNEGCGSIAIAKTMGHAAYSIKNILETLPGYSKDLDFARNTGVQVYCYNKHGALVASYPSIALAARTVGVDPSTISKCCNKVKKSAAGFFWSYSDKEEFEPAELRTWNKFAILQFSTNGELIAEYDSLSAAGRAMNKKQTKYIKECCEGRREQMYGFLWQYKDNYLGENKI